MINYQQAQKIVNALNIKHIALHDEAATANLLLGHALALCVFGVVGALLLGHHACVGVVKTRFLALSRVVQVLECVFCSNAIYRQIYFIILNFVFLRPATAFNAGPDFF